MMTAYDIVIRPIITERAMAGAADKKYVFEVAKSAGKVEIKKAVEEIFGVKVASVNTLIVRGSSDVIKSRLAAFQPILMEALPLTLEEIFIYELGGEDYAVRDIML